MAVSLSADALGLPESLWSSKERKAGSQAGYWATEVLREPATHCGATYGPIGVEENLPPKPLRSGESIGTLAFISSTLSDAVTTKSRPPSSSPEASTGRQASPTQAGSLVHAVLVDLVVLALGIHRRSLAAEAERLRVLLCLGALATGAVSPTPGSMPRRGQGDGGGPGLRHHRSLRVAAAGSSGWSPHLDADALVRLAPGLGSGDGD